MYLAITIIAIAISFALIGFGVRLSHTEEMHLLGKVGITTLVFSILTLTLYLANFR